MVVPHISENSVPKSAPGPGGGTYMDHSGGSREMDFFIELLNDVKLENNNATDCLSLILGGGLCVSGGILV